MAHLHEVRDMDTHFVIDPVTRVITNPNSQKNKLMQGDHNSEIYTFEIPKLVEGHDMSLCNRVRIHYNDIASDKANESKDVYTVDDLHLDAVETDNLTFSWLISGNATKYAGLLSFRIQFLCIDESGAITYKWHTEVFKGITVSDGFDNTPADLEEYSDILAAWELRLDALEAGGGRTHYEETNMVEILVGGKWVAPSSYDFNAPFLEIGKKYIVTWHDGIDYEDTAHEVNDKYGYRIEVGDEGNGYPFTICQYKSGYTYLGGAGGEFTIKTEQTTIKPLDNKYLDLEWLPTTEKIKEFGSVEYPCERTDKGVCLFMANSGADLSRLAGQTVYVVVDGIPYKQIAKPLETGLCIGNLGLIVQNKAYTGEPFAFISDSDLTMFAYGTEPATHTVEIYSVGSPNKMPANLLPSGVPYVEEIILLEESNAYSFTHPSFGKMWAVYRGVPNLTVGETYTITYNGTPYKCVCQAAPAGLIEDPNAVAMGNFSPVGGANTGEPFAMLVSFAYQEVDIIDLVGSSEVKVKIHNNTAATETYLTSPNGTIFKITVSDSGTITATEV